MSAAAAPLSRTTHRTPVGDLMLVASARGLRAIHWPDSSPSTDSLEAVRVADHPILRQTIAQLDEYFAGTRRDFDIPLDLAGTPFQLAAWHALADIPYGETTTYGRQARALGMPNAARAVGSANRVNPVCIVLPCHRVVGADGSLTGFAGGLERKRWLLDHETALTAARSIDSWPSRYPVQRRLSVPVA